MNSSLFFLFAADATLFSHVLVVCFVIFGLILIFTGKILRWQWVRNPWFRLTHLLTIGVVVLQSWFGIVCPLTTLESRRGCLFGYFHISLVRSGSVLRGTTMGIHSLLHDIWAVGVDELVLGSSSSAHKALNKKADAPSGESRQHRLLHADVKLNLASTTKSVQFH